LHFSKLKITKHVVLFSFLCTLLATAYLAIKAYGSLAVLARIGAGEQLPAEQLQELMLGLSTIEHIASIIVVATAISMLTFLVWLFKSYKNAAFLSKTQARFSPYWAVGWFFIPLLNLYKPYQVVQDLWKLTFHEPSQPSFITQYGPKLIQGWWLINIANQLTSVMTNQAASQVKGITGQTFAQVGQQYLSLMEWMTLSSLLSVLVIAGFILIVFNITEKQQASYHQLENTLHS
jgi:hypothetical protein